MASWAVVAAETGGTWTRAVLLTATQDTVELAASGTSTGANPNTVGETAAVSAWTDALTPLAAAAARLRITPTGGCLSVGGPTGPGVNAYRTAFHADAATMPDAQAPAWAMTSTGTATVLVAGTGAIAAVVENGRITRQAGGWGWWLGDEGSGTWLGREILRLALADLDARQETPVTTAIAQMLNLDQLTHAAIFDAAYGNPATVAHATGRFAPLLDTITNDVRVEELAGTAARHLAALVTQLTPLFPITFVGSVATGRVGTLAAERLGMPVTRQTTGLTGTAMAALRTAGIPWTARLRDAVAAAVAGVEAGHARPAPAGRDPGSQ